MNRGSFLKGLLGIGAASMIPSNASSKVIKFTKFKDITNIIDKKSYKIYKAFITKDSTIVSQKDYDELVDAYNLFLDEFLKEDSTNGSDVHFKKGAFAKIKFHLLNNDIKSADSSFHKYFGDLHTMLRLNFENMPTNPTIAIAYREYANHLLYYDYINKAKTKIQNFKQLCNDYALKNMPDKRVWHCVETDSYNGGYKFRDNLCSSIQQI